MGNKPPYFPFFWSDWRTDQTVRLALGPAGKGIYLELLIEQWAEGGVPDDEEKMRTIAGASPEEWAKWWPVLAPKFPLDLDGTRRNPRMTEARDATDRTSIKRRMAALTRHHGGKNGDANALQEELPGTHNQIQIQNHNQIQHPQSENGKRAHPSQKQCWWDAKRKRVWGTDAWRRRFREDWMEYFDRTQFDAHLATLNAYLQRNPLRRTRRSNIAKTADNWMTRRVERLVREEGME